MEPISKITMAKILCMVSVAGLLLGGVVLVISAALPADNFIGVTITTFSFTPLVIAMWLLHMSEKQQD